LEPLHSGSHESNFSVKIDPINLKQKGGKQWNLLPSESSTAPIQISKTCPSNPKAHQRSSLKQYAPGLSDLAGFSHIYLIYHFHKSTTYQLKVTPFLDKVERGLFATRAPKRPNPIGLSVVKLISIENNILTIQGADVLDGTPLLDIKPYIQKFDAPQNPTSGWMQAQSDEIKNKRSDDRFTNN
jgi:tRNA-Thr(GGU) m(6)t(6)A37 methyltransferase TsaA